jgi:L-fuconolactonase
MLDSHVHFWRLARGDYSWLSNARPALYRDYMPDDFKTVIADTPVTGCIVVQAAPTMAETLFLLELADQHPWIFGVTGWADLTAKNVDQALSRLGQRSKLKAIRPMAGAARGPEWLDTPDYAAGFAALERADLAFEALALPHHLEAVATIARTYPSLRIVINHAAKPTPQDVPDWTENFAQFAGLTNVCCKLSGFTQQSTAPDHHRRVFNVLMRVFGPKRLMWGSDHPVLLETSDYTVWLEATDTMLADLSADDRDQITWRTASEFYG